jgi:hypothetical protein
VDSSRFLFQSSLFSGTIRQGFQSCLRSSQGSAEQAFELGSSATAQRFATLQRGRWSEVEKGLSQKIGRGHVGKKRDIEMVLSTLNFLHRIPERNIVAYSVAKIRSNQIEPHFRELQAAQSSSGIRQVGPKVAAVYLRDLVSLFRLEDQVQDNFAEICVQPIDVWVRAPGRSVRIGELQSE